ncbi:MAG: rod shape-determining protein RodA [Candidatus Levybacteria bacterium]|nr:rod shape-determining protein RodA [Candidatus Levybacteria bacterium]
MNRRFYFDIDWALITPIMVLATLSLVTLFSINIELFKNQLLFLIIGIIAFLFFSKVNYSIIKLYSFPIYIASVVSFVLVLFIGIESRGSSRWFEILGFRFQFSEIFKPFLAISLSSYLGSKESYSLKTFFIVFCLLVPLAFLIFMQPDLGNALIYGMVVVLTLLAYGFPKRFFLGLLVLGFLAFPVVFRFLHDYQRERILTFLNPSDPLGLSYNIIQSVISVGSGMLFGRGLGLGTQSSLRFLPELHTDFIFATISEQLGFVGAITIVLAFFVLLYRILKIISHQEEIFSKIFSIAAFFLIFIQFFVNIGMNIGMLPIVGITLPFVSYGGSSLLSSFILIGLISAINKKTSQVLEIR